MTLTIRQYDETYAAGVMELMTQLIDSMAAIDPQKLFKPRSRFNAEAFLHAHLARVKNERGMILVALVDNVPAGYLIATIEEGSPTRKTYQEPQTHGIVDSLFITEAHRGKGISTKLIAQAEEYFRSEHCTHSTVGALFANEPAKAFYRKQGYGEQYVDFMKKL